MPSASWKVNLLALVAALIGFVAIFAAWVDLVIAVWGVDYNLIDLVNHAENTTLIAASWLFVVGVLVSIFTPLGGLLDFAGVVLFMMWFIQATDGRLPSNIGPYLGILAGIVATISLARPIGPGLARGPFRLKNRLLSFSRS